MATCMCNCNLVRALLFSRKLSHVVPFVSRFDFQQMQLIYGTRHLSEHVTTTGETSYESNSVASDHTENVEDYFYNPVSLDKAAHEMLLIRKPNQPADARILRVAIIGSPNAGKSTLVNKILGRRIFPVSKKVHTTRARATGVLTLGKSQIIFLDTPGMVSHRHGRKHHLPRPLLIDAKNVLQEADLVAVIIDASNKWTRGVLDPEIRMALHLNQDVPAVLILNKIDLLANKQVLFEIVADLTEGKVGGGDFDLGRQWSSERQNSELTQGGDALTSEEPRKAWFDDDGEIDGNRTSVDHSLGEETKEQKVLLKSERGSEEEIKDEPQRLQENRKDEDKKLYSRGEDVLERREEGTHPHLADKDKSRILKKLITNLDLITGPVRQKTGRKDAILEDESDEDELRDTKRERNQLMQSFRKRVGWPFFQEVFVVSALNGNGIDNFKNFLFHSSKPGMWEFHSDTVTDLPPEEIVSEAIREKLLEYLPQEVPYRIKQVNELFQVGENDELQIFQKIVCSKKTHVGMIERRKGRISHEATQDLMNAFHCEVFLQIHVTLDRCA